MFMCQQVTLFKDGNVTELTQLTVSLTQPPVTNRVPYESQTQLDNFKGTQSLKEINKQGLTSQIQSTQQITKLSTSLSDTLADQSVLLEQSFMGS